MKKKFSLNSIFSAISLVATVIIVIIIIRNNEFTFTFVDYSSQSQSVIDGIFTSILASCLNLIIGIVIGCIYIVIIGFGVVNFVLQLVATGIVKSKKIKASSRIAYIGVSLHIAFTIFILLWIGIMHKMDGTIDQLLWYMILIINTLAIIFTFIEINNAKKINEYETEENKIIDNTEKYDKNS